mgnify:CR=1 FL=1
MSAPARPRCAHCQHSRIKHCKRGAGWNRLHCSHSDVETWAPLEACWRFERKTLEEAST